jgi:hypothetical protein
MHYEILNYIRISNQLKYFVLKPIIYLKSFRIFMLITLFSILYPCPFILSSTGYNSYLINAHFHTIPCFISFVLMT